LKHLSKLLIEKFLYNRLTLKFLTFNLVRKNLNLRLDPGLQMFFLQGFTEKRTIKCKSGGGLQFLLQTSINDDHFRSAFLNNLEDWEKNVTKQYVDLISIGARIIDVGAYSGVFSILGAMAGAHQIVAIEPNKNIFPTLQENIRINSLEKYVTCLNLACSDRSGFDKLLVPNQRFQSSGAQLSEAKTDRDLSMWNESQKIELTTIDQIVSSLNLVGVDLIKIDVEGSELQVLWGSTVTLIKFRPKIIVELLNDDAKKRCMEFLNKYGYQLYKKLDTTNYLIEYQTD
jgi:FkbM family methyltransferase